MSGHEEKLEQAESTPTLNSQQPQQQQPAVHPLTPIPGFVNARTVERERLAMERAMRTVADHAEQRTAHTSLSLNYTHAQADTGIQRDELTLQSPKSTSSDSVEEDIQYTNTQKSKETKENEEVKRAREAVTEIEALLVKAKEKLREAERRPNQISLPRDSQSSSDVQPNPTMTRTETGLSTVRLPPTDQTSQAPSQFQGHTESRIGSGVMGGQRHVGFQAAADIPIKRGLSSVLELAKQETRARGEDTVGSRIPIRDLPKFSQQPTAAQRLPSTISSNTETQSKPPLTLNTWLSDMENVFDFYEVGNESTRFRYGLLALEGAAKDHVEGLARANLQEGSPSMINEVGVEVKPRTWEWLKESLVKLYDRPQREQLNQDRLDKRLQGNNESIGRYWEDFRHLARLVNQPPLEQYRAFRKGLNENSRRAWDQYWLIRSSVPIPPGGKRETPTAQLAYEFLESREELWKNGEGKFTGYSGATNGSGRGGYHKGRGGNGNYRGRGGGAKLSTVEHSGRHEGIREQGGGDDIDDEQNEGEGEAGLNVTTSFDPSQIICHNCGKPGHKVRGCTIPRGNSSGRGRGNGRGRGGATMRNHSDSNNEQQGKGEAHKQE